MATAKKLESNTVTQCSLCTERYQDPRTLPCTHNFCLQCIDQHCSDQQPGETASCPLCTSEFTIPTNGMKGLPKNFFLEKIMQLQQLMSAQKEQWPCELCSVDDDEEDAKAAAVYCIDCQEKHCESCASLHKKQKATRNHKQVKLGDKLNLNDIVSKSSIQTCNKHFEEQLKFYCTQCKTAICFACYIELHNAHKCSSFSEIADEFRKQMTTDTTEIPAGIDKCDEIIKSLEKEKQSLVDMCKKLENDICDRAELIRQATERHKLKLLSELDTIKRDREQEIDQRRKELELRMMSLEGLKTYSEELVSKGTETDLARETTTIHDRATELLNFEGVQVEIGAMGTIDVSFAASDVHTGDEANVVGSINSKFTFATNQMKLTKTIPSTGQVITGIMTINDEVFVARNGLTQIQVYDTSTFANKRNISLSYSPWGMASCKVNSCIYVACHSNNFILKVDLSTNSVSKQWSPAANPTGLSVTRDSELLVACFGAYRLQKYGTEGTLIQDINLQTIGISNPVHAVETSNGNYLVGYGSYTSMQGLCEVSADGNSIIRKYQATANQLSGYMALSLKGKQGNVLICSGSKNTIQVLDPSLSKTVDLSLPSDIGALNLPFAISFDETRRRLYIGEWSGGRLFVVDSVYF